MNIQSLLFMEEIGRAIFLSLQRKEKISMGLKPSVSSCEEKSGRGFFLIQYVGYIFKFN